MFDYFANYPADTERIVAKAEASYGRLSAQVWRDQKAHYRGMPVDLSQAHSFLKWAQESLKKGEYARARSEARSMYVWIRFAVSKVRYAARKLDFEELTAAHPSVDFSKSRIIFERAVALYDRWDWIGASFVIKHALRGARKKVAPPKAKRHPPQVAVTETASA